MHFVVAPDEAVDAEGPDIAVERVGVHVAGDAFHQLPHGYGHAVLVAVRGGLFAGDLDEFARVGDETGGGHADVGVHAPDAPVRGAFVEFRGDQLLGREHDAVFADDSDDGSGKHGEKLERFKSLNEQVQILKENYRFESSINQSKKHWTRNQPANQSINQELNQRQINQAINRPTKGQNMNFQRYEIRSSMTPRA